MFFDLIRSRRSIRKYSSKKIEPEKVDKLVEAALRAPSSRGCNPWSFVVVDDPGTIKTLSAAKTGGSAFMDKAPLTIVICADPQISDVWIEDASIAAIFVHLAAHELGLASCWIQIRNRMQSDTEKSRDYVAKALALPDTIEPVAMIAVGYGAAQLPGHDRGSLPYDKIYTNKFGQPR